MIEILSDKHEVKARKEHRCDECGGIIAKGETYSTATYKYDDVYTWKQHLRCSEFQKKHGHHFEDHEMGTPPISDWEVGYLSDEVEDERLDILKAAGWKFKPDNKCPSTDTGDKS